jgi:ABC-type transport system substrate-binding protein
VISGMYINYGRPPFDDLRVRQAMCWAIDRDAYNTVISAGLGEVSSAPRPKVDATSDDSTRHYYGYDPDKARKLLADAGHPNGLDLELIGWSDSVSMRAQEFITDQLSKVGFRCKLTPLSPADSGVEFFVKKHGDGRLPLVGVWEEASQEYGNLFGKDGAFNAGGVELPGYRELYEAAQAALDPASRKAAFAKLQRFVVENALVLVIEYQPHMAIATKKVHGLWYDPGDRARFHEVWLDA